MARHLNNGHHALSLSLGNRLDLLLATYRNTDSPDLSLCFSAMYCVSSVPVCLVLHDLSRMLERYNIAFLSQPGVSGRCCNSSSRLNLSGSRGPVPIHIHTSCGIPLCIHYLFESPTLLSLHTMVVTLRNREFSRGLVAVSTTAAILLWTARAISP